MPASGEATLTEYRRRICRAMDYITRHLADDPSLDEAARAAAFSRFHFHRIFHTIVGETVAEFTRRLRLEKAACLLAYNVDRDVTSIAMECGFSSSQNFARAFRKHFDQSPTEYRQLSKGGHRDRKDGNASAWPPTYDAEQMTWPATNVARRHEMNVEVKEMPEYHVAYARNIGPYGPEGCGGAFERLYRWAGPRGHAATGTCLGVSWDNPEVTPPEKCRYDACLTVPEGTRTEGEIGLQTIPGGTFAVYHCKIRTDEFEKAWNDLMGVWLPTSGYQPDDKPCYELCHQTAESNPEGLWVVDICCPVKPL